MSPEDCDLCQMCSRAADELAALRRDYKLALDRIIDLERYKTDCINLRAERDQLREALESQAREGARIRGYPEAEWKAVLTGVARAALDKEGASVSEQLDEQLRTADRAIGKCSQRMAELWDPNEAALDKEGGENRAD